MKTVRNILTLAFLLVAGVADMHAQAYTQSSYYSSGATTSPQNPTTVTYTPAVNNRWWGSDVYEEKYYGLRIGPAFTYINSDNALLDGDSMKTGLNIGFVYGHKLTDSAPLFLETGVSFIEKGGRCENKEADENGIVAPGRVKFNLSYFQVPVVVKYVYDVDGTLSVQPFVGAYMALGIGGKTKNYGTHSVRNSFGSRKNQFNRFDGGLKLGCGIGYDVLYAELAYEAGLTNISHDDFDSSHSSNISITVGVNF